MVNSNGLKRALELESEGETEKHDVVGAQPRRNPPRSKQKKETKITPTTTNNLTKVPRQAKKPKIAKRNLYEHLPKASAERVAEFEKSLKELEHASLPFRRDYLRAVREGASDCSGLFPSYTEATLGGSKLWCSDATMGLPGELLLPKGKQDWLEGRDRWNRHDTAGHSSLTGTQAFTSAATQGRSGLLSNDILQEAKDFTTDGAKENPVSNMDMDLPEACSTQTKHFFSNAHESQALTAVVSRSTSPSPSNLGVGSLQMPRDGPEGNIVSDLSIPQLISILINRIVSSSSIDGDFSALTPSTNQAETSILQPLCRKRQRAQGKDEISQHAASQHEYQTHAKPNHISELHGMERPPLSFMTPKRSQASTIRNVLPLSDTLIKDPHGQGPSIMPELLTRYQELKPLVEIIAKLTKDKEDGRSETLRALITAHSLLKIPLRPDDKPVIKAHSPRK